MILLDKPLVSDFVKDSIRKNLFSALDTGCVLPEGELELLDEDEALERLQNNPDERIHTISENSLAWIEEKLRNPAIKESVRLFKDKFAFRELTADLFPGLFYKKVKASELDHLNEESLKFPFLIKPNIGFFSMGVYKVANAEAWELARHRISAELEQIQSIYPKAVLNTSEFIIEEVIEGEEYAFDAYFDENGEAVLVGVMHHLFGSETDVSDRVYLTSAEIVNRHKDLFHDFLAEIGKRAGLKNFSMHVEARINDKGMLVPIEINPLRFGAWCTSADLMHHAFGFNAYHCYLNNIRPDWDQITAKMSDDTFGIIILDNSTGITGSMITSFDYNAVLKNFTDIMELRKVNYKKYPIFGIIFTRIKTQNISEVEQILTENFKKYIFFSLPL